MSHFEAIKISDDIYWVGAIDWELRNFHGYQTSRGSTYNAFLIVDERPTLIDAVKAPFLDEMLARVASVIDPSKIDVVVSNHAEMDHSGGLPRLLERVAPSTVLASPNGVKALQAHFHWDKAIQAVKDGSTLSLGKNTLRFVETKMIHWPDSMFSYVEEQGVLFSNDAFGMHLASTERFVDELDQAVTDVEAAKYYANIILPLSPIVGKLLERLPKLGFDLKLIAPDHGPLWRQDLQRIIGAYARWAEQRPTRKAVLVYDTMWHSTESMAHVIAEGIAKGGARPVLMPLSGSHRSDIATEILDAGALLVGSPTINNQLYPTVADAISYLKGLNRKNLVGAAFGSYGWNAKAVPLLDAALTDMGVQLLGEGLRVNYVPDAEALAACRALGERVAARLQENQA
ncbi:MAG: FprA family A-type flavoprotein [Myxococcota bacterium]|jgi:flavorubredoxin|nr:FprA family A-type flavoprotein [Myxococcota bacterium]